MEPQPESAESVPRLQRFRTEDRSPSVFRPKSGGGTLLGFPFGQSRLRSAVVWAYGRRNLSEHRPNSTEAMACAGLLGWTPAMRRPKRRGATRRDGRRISRQTGGTTGREPPRGIGRSSALGFSAATPTDDGSTPPLRVADGVPHPSPDSCTASPVRSLRPVSYSLPRFLYSARNVRAGRRPQASGVFGADVLNASASAGTSERARAGMRAAGCDSQRTARSEAGSGGA